MESCPYLRRGGRSFRGLNEMASSNENNALMWCPARTNARNVRNVRNVRDLRNHSISPPLSPCLQWRRRVTGHFRNRMGLPPEENSYVNDLNVSVRNLSLDSNSVPDLVPLTPPLTPIPSEAEEEEEDEEISGQSSPVLGAEFLVSDHDNDDNDDDDDDNDNDDDVNKLLGTLECTKETSCEDCRAHCSATCID